MLTIKDFNTNKAVSVYNLTLTKPSSVVVGDLLLILCANDSNGVDEFFKPLTSWNFFINVGSNSPDVYLGCYWRIADGSEEATELIEQIQKDDMVGWYLNISGYDSLNPIGEIGAASLVNSSHNTNTPESINVTSTDDLAFSLMGYDGSDGEPFTCSRGSFNYLAVPSNSSGASAAWIAFNPASLGDTSTTWDFIANEGSTGINFAVNALKYVSGIFNINGFSVLTSNYRVDYFSSAKALLTSNSEINFIPFINNPVFALCILEAGATFTFKATVTNIYYADASLTSSSTILVLGSFPKPLFLDTLDIFGDGSCDHLWTFDGSNLVDKGISNIDTPGTITYVPGAFDLGAKPTAYAAMSFAAGPTDSPFAISTWIKIASYSSTYIWFTNTNNSLRIYDNGGSIDDIRIDMHYSGGALVGVVRSPKFVLNKWIHVLIQSGPGLRGNDAGIRICVDGEAALGGSDHFQDLLPFKMYLSATGGHSSDQIRMFNRAITDAELDILLDEGGFHDSIISSALLSGNSSVSFKGLLPGGYFSITSYSSVSFSGIVKYPQYGSIFINSYSELLFSGEFNFGHSISILSESVLKGHQSIEFRMYDRKILQAFIRSQPQVSFTGTFYEHSYEVFGILSITNTSSITIIGSKFKEQRTITKISSTDSLTIVGSKFNCKGKCTIVNTASIYIPYKTYTAMQIILDYLEEQIPLLSTPPVFVTGDFLLPEDIKPFINKEQANV